MAEQEADTNLNKLMVKCTDGEFVGDAYNAWANTYNEDHHTANFVYLDGFKTIITTVDKYFSGRKDALIMDVGAGTGVAGKQLKEMGYTNIDAMDASREMLNVAQKDEIYRNVYCHCVGQDPLTIPDNTYDCVITLGTIGPNHLPASALPDLCAILKPGGLFILQGNNARWVTLPEYHVTMAKMIEDMVAEKKWEQLEWKIITDYLEIDGKPNQGIFFVFRKL